MAEADARMRLIEARRRLAQELRLKAACGGAHGLALSAQECIYLANALDRAELSSDLDRREAAVRAAEVAADAQAASLAALAGAANAEIERARRIINLLMFGLVAAMAVKIGAFVLEHLSW